MSRMALKKNLLIQKDMSHLAGRQEDGVHKLENKVPFFCLRKKCVCVCVCTTEDADW
jgi:hypothetical protein